MSEYLYVCHFSNGHIKVGRSIDPKSRIAVHAERVACLGVELIEHHLAECVGHSSPAETELIGKCANEAVKQNKNEWFIGLDFLVVCEWANEIAAKPVFTSKPTRKYNAFCEWLDSVEGRTNAVAAHFGVTKSAVSQWRGRGVPVDNMKAMRDFTGGQVTLEEMIPGEDQKASA